MEIISEQHEWPFWLLFHFLFVRKNIHTKIVWLRVNDGLKAPASRQYFSTSFIYYVQFQVHLAISQIYCICIKIYIKKNIVCHKSLAWLESIVQSAKMHMTFKYMSAIINNRVTIKRSSFSPMHNSCL